MWGGVGPPPPPPPDMGLEACSWSPMGDGCGDMYPKAKAKKMKVSTLMLFKQQLPTERTRTFTTSQHLKNKANDTSYL